MTRISAVHLILLLLVIGTTEYSIQNPLKDGLTCFSDGAACIMDAQCCCKHCRWAINGQTCVPLNEQIDSALRTSSEVFELEPSPAQDEFKKAEARVKIFAATLNQNLKGQEHCYWISQPCPMGGGESRPICSIWPNVNDPRHLIEICTMQSNAIGGGSFNVDIDLPGGHITGVDTRQNQHCQGVSISGMHFHTHCGCSGHCNVHGWWTVHII